MSNGLDIRGVTVELGGARLLDGIDLSVEPGRWVSVVGPNGAGKTTLVHAIAGGVPLKAGRVLLDGRDVRRLRARARARSIALVPQSPVVPAGMSVLDYALLGRTPHLAFFATETSDDVERSTEVLEDLGVRHLADRLLETLSGGERQRVVLARALLQDAPLLLLDEPTSALDIGHQQDVLELVERLRDTRNLAVVSTMHDLTLAARSCDRLAVLHQGRLHALAAPAEALSPQVLAEVFGLEGELVASPAGPTLAARRRG